MVDVLASTYSSILLPGRASVIDGSLWKCMEWKYGSMEVCMEVYGSIWKHMEAYGSIWKHMGVYCKYFGDGIIF